MDKLKTLDVLRGMKFMQRKEEAKRRATYEHQRYQSLRNRVPDGCHISADPAHRAHPPGSHGTDRVDDEGNSVSNDDSRAHDDVTGRTGGNSSLPSLHRSMAVQRPIILYDAVCPTSTYAHARRRFDPHRVSVTETSASDTLVPSSPSSSSPEAVRETAVGVCRGTASHAVADSTAHDPASIKEEYGADRTVGRTAMSTQEHAENNRSHSRGDIDTSATAPDPTAVGNDGCDESSNDNKVTVRCATKGAKEKPDRFYVNNSIRAPKVPKRLREAVKEENRAHKRRFGGASANV